MKNISKITPFAISLLLALNFTACSDDQTDNDLQSENNTSGSGYESVTDMSFLDGKWSVNGNDKLYFNSTEGYYEYRTFYGLGGYGEFYEVDGKPMIKFNGFLYDFMLRDDGVLLPNQNGDDSDNNSLSIHRNTYTRDDSVEITEFPIDNFDGMWQNASGETIVIDTALGQYIACSPDYNINGTVNDAGEGMGPYLYSNGSNAYICASADGNSFTLSGGDAGEFAGVFYRNGDIGAYTDISQAKFFYGKVSDTFLWYFDGVNEYFVGFDYELADDGFAYTEDGKVYPAGWIPEQPYDPSGDWGENWMDNWDI